MSSILITGAAGFIGSYLCDRLIADGREVVGIDNYDDFYNPAAKRRNLANAKNSALFTFEEGDVREAAFLDNVLKKHTIDTVVHLAARPGVRPSIANPALYINVNVGGTISVLEAMRRHGVRRFIFASSSSVYGNRIKAPFHEDDPVDYPISPYAASKKACELICHTYAHLHGLEVSCLRFFTVYGPRQRPEMAISLFMKAAMDSREIVLYGNGSVMRDFTYIDDIIDGVLASIENINGYSIINLGGANSYTLENLIARIEAVTGITMATRHEPLPPGDVLLTSADTSRAYERLGFVPKIDLTTGLKRQWEWMKSRRKS